MFHKVRIWCREIAIIKLANKNYKYIHSKKKSSVYDFKRLFFVHIPLVYQSSTYTSLYTKIFNFSHFCDFHIPFLYQNCHIPTIYQNLLHIPAVYQSVKTSFLVFAMVRHYFLGDITNFLIIVHYFMIVICFFENSEYYT